MNIHELSLRARIPVASLRRLLALKVLKVDPEPDISATIRFAMRGGAKLSVPHMLALIDEPELIDTLQRFADRARAQIAALGDFKATSAPPEVTAYIIEAGRAKDSAALVLVEWAKSVLPTEPVDYAWLAVRLLAPLPVGLREQCAKLTTLALLHMRRAPEFTGYWHAVKRPGKRDTVLYHAQIRHDL